MHSSGSVLNLANNQIGYFFLLANMLQYGENVFMVDNLSCYSKCRFPKKGVHFPPGIVIIGYLITVITSFDYVTRLPSEKWVT